MVIVIRLSLLQKQGGVFRLGQLVQQTLKLQFSEEFINLALVVPVQPQILEVKRKLHGPDDADQPFRELGVLLVLQEECLHPLGNALRIFALRVVVDFLKRAEFLQKLGSGFFSNAAYTGDVIGRIAPESFVIDQLIGTESVPLLDRGLVVNFCFCEPLLRSIYFHRFVNELKCIEVSRQNHHSEVPFFRDC